MNAASVVEQATRYASRTHPSGVAESTSLDFHSPYGCSKGAADQYFHDYARIYGLKSVIFRQSCIYGYRQFGIEDQGWVAWFIIAHLLGKDITVYGNGKQVRDILFVDDLIRAYDLAVKDINKARGQIYNIGGGPKNQISLLELIRIIENLTNRVVRYNYTASRQGDQKIYVSDISKAKRHFHWQPRIGVTVGITKLLHWIEQHMDQIQEAQLRE